VNFLSSFVDMSRVAFVFACLAYAGQGRRVQTSVDQLQDGGAVLSKELASLLLATNPALASRVFSATPSHVSAGIDESQRVRTPLLSDDDFDGIKPETVFMFPGQGAQSVGMGAEVAKDVPAAAELYKKASEILGYDLLAIDDKAKLDTTAVSQPAIFVASMAAVEKLRASEGGQDIIDSANIAAGLSLGEYSALAFAGAISFEDGVRITKARGEAMQAAADASSSGMVSVIGLDKEKTTALCEAASKNTGTDIAIANYLCNGNYACSGAMEGVEEVMKIAKPESRHAWQ
jgi:[acyl-carrier-protein] S-malonyltransferase